MIRTLLCLALLTLGSAAGAVTPTSPANLVVLGYCQLSVTTAVLISTCSTGIPATATWAYITPEAAIRWRDDATAPTAAIGYPLSSGQQLTYGGNLTTMQVVSQSGTATVNVAFYRY